MAQKPEEVAVAVVQLPHGQRLGAIDISQKDRQHLAMTTLLFFKA